MRRTAFFCAVVTLGAACWAQQPSALLANRDALALYERVVQLIESTSAAVPGLARASAPVLENARSALEAARASSQQSSPQAYEVLSNARAYLALAESMPKPFPFPETARNQFTELRQGVDRIESHFRALLDTKEAQLRSPDRDNVLRYAQANERLGPPAADKPRVVFLGDSITDFWRLNEYFGERDFVNRGISGQITGEMLGRMKPDVIDLRPRAVIVLAGTNDIARGVPLTTIENNLSMIADLGEAHGIKPLFASVLPISDYHKAANPMYERSHQRPPSTVKDLNTWIRKFCAERKYPYVDYYSAMADKAGFLPANLADDGLHPNGAGYRIMAPLALQAIDTLLKIEPPVQQKKRRFKLM
jgi:lysophospholipase L1-like esterase